MRNRRMLVALTAALALFATACGGDDEGDTTAEATEEAAAAETEAESMETEMETEAAGGGEELSGTIAIDGSSTVGPLTSAISEEYASEQPDVTVNVGVSGTGGGFERFCGSGDTAISNASRDIGEEEIALCEENGIEFTEVRVGTDALTMVVNPQNDWVDCLNDEQITAIWGSDRVANWSEVPELGDAPDVPIEIFAPATTSGTYDFFNETIEIENPTQDYSATENDNDIVRGVSGTEGGWGYFGFAFFSENQEQIKALGYDAGEGCVEPTVENAQNDEYQLTRPLFIYIKNEALNRPEVVDFARFYLNNVNNVIEQVGYIAAPEETIQESLDTLNQAVEEVQG